MPNPKIPYPSLLDFYNSMSNNDDFRLIQNHHFFIDIEFDNPKLSPLFLNGKPPETFIIKDQGLYVRLLSRSAELPNFTTNVSVEPIENDFGRAVFSGVGSIVPAENSFSINFLSTEFPIHERFFLEWLKETMSNTYQRGDRPFSKAKIRVTFLNQDMDREVLQYVFEDSFPIGFDTINPNYAADGSNNERAVTFQFNWAWVDNKYSLRELKSRVPVRELFTGNLRGLDGSFNELQSNNIV
jgi:hypothetical protein